MKLTYDVYGLDNQKLFDLEEAVGLAHVDLVEKTGKGNEFLGWLRYDAAFDAEMLQQIKAVAQEIRERAQVLVVLGIGGSYLGARAVLEALTPHFGDPDVEILFAGHHLSGEYLCSLLEYISDKSVYVNVISKSGTTLETAVAFRAVRNLMKEKYDGEEFSRRIIATTDPERGALRAYADSAGLRSFPIPGDIGGRYSVFTSVGLLPIAAGGIDLDALLRGLKRGIEDFNQSSFGENLAHQYAAMRYTMDRDGKRIELLVTQDPKLRQLGEWFKQLFGESEGKDGRGLFPASAQFSTDLHSLGQLIQDGRRNLFETMLIVDEQGAGVVIPRDLEDVDGLNALAGRTLEELDVIMMRSAMKAHLSGQVPCGVIEIRRLDAANLAYLMYFMMKACAISGYLLGVNPFDQPGVEAYKSHMRDMMK